MGGLKQKEWMTPGEVAALFGVSPKTVVRWFEERELPYAKTLGGHRRYNRKVVEELVAAAGNTGAVAVGGEDA